MLRFLCLLLFLVACARKSGYPAAEPGYYGDYEESAKEAYDGAPAARSEAPRPAPSRAQAGAPPAEDMPATDPSPAAEPAPAARMVHYDGWLQVRVTRVDAGVDAVKALAERHHGFVEAIGADFVRVRVPAAAFRVALDEARALGEVLDETVSAQDVTEAFTSTDLRLRTARATRDRLQALLARSEDEQERLQLLREIQRVTGEIDELEAQLRTLASLAALSRITVQLVPREALAWQGAEDETAELAWIRALSPFRTDVSLDAKKLDVPTPAGLVRLQPRGPFVAESADGTRVWSHRVENTPRGDAAFWLDALATRLGRDFATVERLEVGGWRVLRLVDRSDEPYTWWVAVRVDGDRLLLVQAFFPNAAQEARYGDAVRAALTEVSS